MKTEIVVFLLLIVMFGAILFGDAVLTTVNPEGMLLSLNDAKGIAGFTFLLVALLFFINAREQ
jgi:polyferredoxin